MAKVFIIAEAGVNHNGSLETAKEMVLIAAKAGADAVKFQTFNPDEMVNPIAKKAEYQSRNLDNTSGSQLEMLRNLVLSNDDHVELMAYCKESKIQFLSSPFDVSSASFLEDLGLEIFKIPSGEITNLPLLRKIGGLRKHVIMSTGMADLAEIGQALEALTQAGTDESSVTLLHCNTEYPTPFEDVNLNAMLTLKREFGLAVGFSDHTLGTEASVAAVALGATVIEKHFTLDKTAAGPDHLASLDVAELERLVREIRHIEQALGSGLKRPSKSEAKNIIPARKSIFAAKQIKKGTIIKDDMLAVQRPAKGLSPMLWDKVVGRKARRDYVIGEIMD